ncbi:MAG TPA: hypothetical protein VHW23_31160 [Kofleriaceae bacterium]|jgi:hypothetical protein|nr:hypothetical protein [Kofleriaceae bacterium]
MGDHADDDEDGGDVTEDVPRAVGDAMLEVAQLQPALAGDRAVALRHAADAADDDHRALRAILRRPGFAAPS